MSKGDFPYENFYMEARGNFTPTPYTEPRLEVEVIRCLREFPDEAFAALAAAFPALVAQHLGTSLQDGHPIFTQDQVTMTVLEDVPPEGQAFHLNVWIDFDARLETALDHRMRPERFENLRQATMHIPVVVPLLGQGKCFLLPHFSRFIVIHGI